MSVMLQPESGVRPALRQMRQGSPDGVERRAPATVASAGVSLNGSVDKFAEVSVARPRAAHRVDSQPAMISVALAPRPSDQVLLRAAPHRVDDPPQDIVQDRHGGGEVEAHELPRFRIEGLAGAEGDLRRVMEEAERRRLEAER